MKCPPLLLSEAERLAALAEYGLGGDRPLPSLDPVVRIAAHMFGMPVAAVNMVGTDHVFLAAQVGVNQAVLDLRRDVSFCAHAIAQSDVLLVPDTTLDERFHDNPLVTGPANLRFYAGVPLLSPQGHALGALCLIDGRPRPDFSADDCLRLAELARMAADRLELRRIEVSTEKSHLPFEVAARHSPTAVIGFEGQGRIVDWNDAAKALFGRTGCDACHRSFDSLVVEEDRVTLRSLIARALAQGSSDGLGMPESLTGLRADGSRFRLGLSLFCWPENGTLRFDAHLQDLGPRHRRDDALQRLASTDTLTGLANRARLYRALEEMLTRPSAAAVLLFDIDSFKDVNDTLGHRAGDTILREIAERLRLAAGQGNDVARIGGDEFALLLGGVSCASEAVRMAREVLNRVAQPVVVEGHEVRMVASCGVALAPEHAREALELIGSADLALFHAKQQGRGQISVFSAALRREATARRLYNIELHRAVSEGEFVLFYQPQIRLADGALAGAEALIRWRHPERGLLSPAAFLPALESGPLAVPVGRWVLDEACAQAAAWHRAGADNFRIGVNLFGAQFQADDLVDEVTAALERHGLPPQALELEVTENIVLEHNDRVLEALQRLRQMGVGIAFDDFGTGYASLSLLKQYPLSRLKIDRSFVQSMLESERDATVVRAILEMARSFGLETVAEGVEQEPQSTRLYAFGCEEGQGYWFGRPVPALQFAEVFGLDSAVPMGEES